MSVATICSKEGFLLLQNCFLPSCLGPERNLKLVCFVVVCCIEFIDFVLCDHNSGCCVYCTFSDKIIWQKELIVKSNVGGKLFCNRAL